MNYLLQLYGWDHRMIKVPCSTDSTRWLGMITVLVALCAAGVAFLLRFLVALLFEKKSTLVQPLKVYLLQLNLRKDAEN